MEKKYLELIYQDYLDEITQLPEEEIETAEIKIDKNTEEKLKSMFTKIEPKPIKEKPEIEKGNVYLFFEKHIPIHYVVYESFEDGLYEVLKVTDYWELANHNDLITKINDEIFAVETWNGFYLTEEEIEKSTYYGKLPEEDFRIIEDFKEGKIESLPEGKRGLKATDPESIQIKFHEKESQIVRKFKLRLLESSDNELVFDIPLEEESDLLLELAAAEERSIARSELFILKADKENNLYILNFFPQLYGKKARIKILNRVINIKHLPERIYINPMTDLKKLDIEKVARRIEVILEQN